MIDILEGILFWTVMAVFASAAIAAAWCSPPQRKARDKALAKFKEGTGPNPDRMAFGPHKSFKQNFVVFFAACAGTGLTFGLPTLLGGLPK